MNWQAIYDREAPVLYSYLVSQGASRDLAEDAIQEVFMAVLSTQTQVKNPRAYLFAGVRRAYQRLKSLDKPFAALELVDVEQKSSESLFDAEKVNQALSSLSPEQREVVVLRIWHQMTFREIAESLEISPDTVASRWRYGILKLKQLLKTQENVR